MTKWRCHSFVTSAPDAGQWSVCLQSTLLSAKEPPVPMKYVIRLAPKAVWRFSRKEKSLAAARN